jgi:cellulase/cellobiase CelA1
MKVFEAGLGSPEGHGTDSARVSRPKLRYALLRPALDACAAFGLFVLVSLTLSSAPSSASPHHLVNPVVATQDQARPAFAAPSDQKIYEITSKSVAAADNTVYRQTDTTAAWLLLSFAFSVLAAFNMALVRHLRQAYANPRKRQQS